MLKLLNRIDWSAFEGSIMATVTYPPECVEKRYAVRTKQRSRLLRSLEKIAGKQVPTIWRQEWKRRKSGADKGQIVSHMHYLIPGMTYLDQWAWREAWRSIVHKEGPLATDVTKIGKGEMAARYMSKYVAKDDTLDIAAYLNTGIEIGRHWGPTRRNLMPLAKVAMQRKLDDEETEWVKHHAKTSWPDRPYVGESGFTVFGAECAEFFQNKFGENVLTGQV